MISFSKLSKCFLDQSMNEANVVKCLKELSTAFTQKRNKIDELYASKKHISTYASFYLPTNMHKMEFLLSVLNERQLEAIKRSTIVEVGTGPGTYIFALLSCLPHLQNSFIGVDHSPLMLEQAKSIQNQLYASADISWRSDIPHIEGEKTYIFGNSINEMGHSCALRIVKTNDVDHVICIEPGTKSSFEQMSKFREGMIKAGYNVLYPCFSNERCPILEVQDDWCHQVVKTKLDDSIERLSQMAKLDRKTMPAIIHFYSKDSQRETGARVIRLVKSVKHAFIWELCLGEEKGNQILRVEVPKKLFAKKKLKELENMSAGLSISYDIDKELGNGLYRIKNVTV